MSRENYIVEKIDRKREASSSKAARSARNMFLRMEARKLVTSGLVNLSDPTEQAAFLGDLIDIAAEHRHPIIGKVETATALNAVAADVCSSLRLPRAIARAKAEQAFSTLSRDDLDRILP